jgi:hypothetical protein
MKKLIFIAAFFSICSAPFAQGQSELEIEPTLKEGDILLTGFFGLPNWGTFFLENHFRDPRVNSGVSRGLPPLSLEMEYFFSDRISGTLTGIYNSWGATWKEITVDNVDGFFLETEHDFSFDVSRLRILLGINYHYYDFGIENVDLYAGVAVGANSLFPSHNSTLANWHPRNVNYYNEAEGDLEFPLSYRLRAGLKYFVNDNLGFNVEVGLGGATFNLGINYKL